MSKGLDLLRAQACKQLQAALSLVAAEINGDGELERDVVSFLYWGMEDIPADWLMKAFKVSNVNFLDMAGPFPTEIDCQECGQSIEVASRTEHQRLKNELNRGRKQVCEACRKGK